jgi:hypothetical protein
MSRLTQQGVNTHSTNCLFLLNFRSSPFYPSRSNKPNSPPEFPDAHTMRSLSSTEHDRPTIREHNRKGKRDLERSVTRRSLAHANRSIRERHPTESTALLAPLMELRTCDSDCAPHHLLHPCICPNWCVGWTLRHTSRGPYCFIAQAAIIHRRFGHRLTFHPAVINMPRQTSYGTASAARSQTGPTRYIQHCVLAIVY